VLGIEMKQDCSSLLSSVAINDKRTPGRVQYNNLDMGLCSPLMLDVRQQTKYVCAKCQLMNVEANMIQCFVFPTGCHRSLASLTPLLPSAFPVASIACVEVYEER